MKKRLIALLLVLCMVLSIIPVYAAESTASAGTLELDTPVPVTLDAGEEVTYTFDALGGTRYYYYVAPDGTESNLGAIEIDPQPAGAVNGSGHSYEYADAEGFGTIFVAEADTPMHITLRNYDVSPVSFNVAVAQANGDAASMTLNTPNITITLDNAVTLIAKFLPVFSYEEDITFTVDNENILTLGTNGASALVIPKNIGTATITATAGGGNFTVACPVEVTAPENAIPIAASDSVGITFTADQWDSHILSFTAPADGRYVMYSDAQEAVRMEPVGQITDSFIRQEMNLILYELVKDQTVYFRVISEGIYSGTLDVTAALCTDATEFSVVPQQSNVPVGDFLYFETEFKHASEYTPVTWSTSNNQVIDIPNASLYAADFLAVGDGTATITATTDAANPVSVSWEITVGDGSTDDDSNISGDDATIPDDDSDISGDSTTVPDDDTTNSGGVAPTQAFPLLLDALTPANANEDGIFALTYTPENSGLYFLGIPAHQTAEILEVSPAVNKYCDHDMPYVENSYYGPVYPLDAGVTYSFTVYTDTTDPIYYYLCDGPVADAISPWDTEVTGYAGTSIDLYYDLTPTDAFGGVSATSSDESVVIIEGGNNADPCICIHFLKPGTATVTATTASGLTATTKVTVLKAPELTLTKPVTFTVEPDKAAACSFTAPDDGTYTFTITGSTENYFFNSASSIIREISDGTTTYYWAELLAGETVITQVYNIGFDTDTYSVSAMKTPAATAISLPDQEVYSNAGYLSLDALFTPITAYEEIVDWTVSDPSVLTLNDFGDAYAVFTILKSGKVTVTATSESGLKATCTVNIADPIQLELNKAQTFTVEGEDALELVFTAPKTGYYFAEMDLQSSVILNCGFDSDILEESLCGYWTYLEEGQVWDLSLLNLFPASDSYTLQIHDATAPITALTLTPSQTKNYLGTESEIYLTIDPTLSYDLDEVIFSDPSIVEYHYIWGHSLFISPAKAGATEVTVTTKGGVSAKCTITFLEPAVLTLDKKESVTLAPNERTFYSFDAVAGEQYFFYSDQDRVGIDVYSDGCGSVIYYDYEIGEDSDYKGTIYIAEESGTVLIGIGNYSLKTITFTLGAVKTVEPTEISLESRFSTLYVGQNVDLSVVFKPTFAFDESVSFQQKGDVVSIPYADRDFCTVYAQKPGTATVTATTDSGLTASYTFTVLEPDTLSVNTDIDLTLPEDGHIAYRFTAPEDGTYDITSTGLFRFEVHRGADDCFYNSGSAQTSVPLSKGETVLLVVRAESDTSGTFNIHKHAGIVSDITLPAVNGITGTTQTVLSVFKEADAYLPTWVAWFIADSTIAEIVDDAYNGVKLHFLKAGTTTLTMETLDKTFTTTVTVTDSIVIPSDPNKPATVTPEAVDQALKDALDNAVEGKPAEVILSISDAAASADTTVTQVELHVASLEAVAAADAILTVQLSNATVTLDAKALESVIKQAQGSQVILKVEEVGVKSLNEKQQKAVSKHNVATVFNAELICAKTGKTIWTKDSKHTLGSIAMQYSFTPEPGYELKNYTVLFVDDDGKLEKNETAYDEDADRLLFTLKHFSSYIIARDYVETEATTPPATNPATGDPFPLGLAVLVMVMAIGAAAGICFSKRRTVQ